MYFTFIYPSKRCCSCALFHCGCLGYLLQKMEIISFMFLSKVWLSVCWRVWLFIQQKAHFRLSQIVFVSEKYFPPLVVRELSNRFWSKRQQDTFAGSIHIIPKYMKCSGCSMNMLDLPLSAETYGTTVQVLQSSLHHHSSIMLQSMMGRQM